MPTYRTKAPRTSKTDKRALDTFGTLGRHRHTLTSLSEMPKTPQFSVSLREVHVSLQRSFGSLMCLLCVGMTSLRCPWSPEWPQRCPERVLKCPEWPKSTWIWPNMTPIWHLLGHLHGHPPHYHPCTARYVRQCDRTDWTNQGVKGCWRVKAVLSKVLKGHKGTLGSIRVLYSSFLTREGTLMNYY